MLLAIVDEQLPSGWASRSGTSRLPSSIPSPAWCSGSRWATSQPFGLRPPPRGLYARAREGQIPILDVGLIDALKSGRVTVVSAVRAFEGRDVILEDGSRVQPDAVIAATGYLRALEGLVGHLGVLDQRGVPLVHGEQTHPRAPGMYFIGYSNPISGNLREIGIDARKIAKALRRSLRLARAPNA